MPVNDRYAVFGFPVKHSKSPMIHRAFARQTGHTEMEYTAIEVPADSFSTALTDFFGNGGKGLNCTVPLKELAFAAADETSERAARCGAVNTLALREDGSLFGDNTDGIGLVTDLTSNLGVELEGRRILILGAGGAGRGILGPLLDRRPARLMIANRTPARAAQLVANFPDSTIAAGGFSELAGSEFDIVINSTSASLSGQLPDLPDGILGGGGCCYDLAYANQPTAFVQWGQGQRAAVCVDGLGMLVEQAAEAFRIWRGVRPETSAVIRLLESERMESANR